jgi:hypothetical protein
MGGMGSLNYDGHIYDFEDRFLAHVQVVLSQKMRRRESFLLSWTAPSYEEAWGRVSLWISPSAEVSFRYSGSKAAAVNGSWLEQMMSATNSTRGLDLDMQKEPQTGSPANG